MCLVFWWARNLDTPDCVLLTCAALHVKPTGLAGGVALLVPLLFVALLAPTCYCAATSTLDEEPLPPTFWSFIKLSLDNLLLPLPNMVLNELEEIFIWAESTLSTWSLKLFHSHTQGQQTEKNWSEISIPKHVLHKNGNTADQPSEYRLTIYHYAIIVSFSKYR